MRVLTYNVGLLDLRLFGHSLVKPADFIEERFASLAPALLGLDADIIALQELYESTHKRALCAAMSTVYPYVAVSPLRGPSLVPASLVTLSRWPIIESRFFRFRHMPVAERLVDNKGYLVAVVQGPHGPMTTVNVHTTAGGARHPEALASDHIRARQLDELLAQVCESGPLVLTGDFNCGSVSVTNYRQILEAGYVDVWTQLHSDAAGHTWDPVSVLNHGGTHTRWGCPAQRIDLVLLNSGARARWRPLNCEVVLNRPCIPTRSQHLVTLSDHYGVLATLEPIATD